MSSRWNEVGLALSGVAIVGTGFGLARYTIGLFVPEIESEFLLSSAEMGLIIGGTYLGYLVATIVGTVLATLQGPRVPIVLGGLTAAIGMSVMALSHSQLWLALGVFVAGTSPGLSYPAYSAAIINQVAEKRRNRVYGIVNSGTGFGVALSAPIALLAVLDWRTAYWVFVLVALLATVLNFKFVEQGPPQQKNAALSKNIDWRLINWTSAPFFASALLFGIATSAYWSFAVDVLHIQNNNPTARSIFWSVLGVSGMLGVFAGWIVDNLGLARANLLVALLLSVSVCALPFIGQSEMLIYGSAALFGAGFVTVTAFYGMRSMSMFPQAATPAFGLTFFMISLGQGIGAPIVGSSFLVIGPTLSFVLMGAMIALLSMLPLRLALTATR